MTSDSKVDYLGLLRRKQRLLPGEECHIGACDGNAGRSVKSPSMYTVIVTTAPVAAGAARAAGAEGTGGARTGGAREAGRAAGGAGGGETKVGGGGGGNIAEYGDDGDDGDDGDCLPTRGLELYRVAISL